ncbi:MAG: hypothetical protein HOP19_02790, partial [Acidobacteria bacterium]|nr:hypothetical protein [Acidobacteriota bacterium]
LFAGTRGSGVYFSSDGGVSWKPFNQSLGNLNITALAFGNNRLLAGTPAGVYATTLTDATRSLPPVADAQFLTTDEDTPINIRLTGSDPQGKPLQFEVPDWLFNLKIVSGTPPNVVYTPQADFNGATYFYFRVFNQQLSSRWSNIYLKVNPVNDAPRFRDLPNTVTGSEEEGIWLDTATDDPENHSVLVKASVLPPGASYCSERLFRWMPPGIGTYTVTFTAREFSDEALSVTKSVTLNVVGNPEKGRWTALTKLKVTPPTSWLAIDNALLAATPISPGGSNSTLSRWRPGETTWKEVTDGLPYPIFIGKLRSSGNVVYASTDVGLFRSLYQGDSWSLVQSGPYPALTVHQEKLFFTTGIRPDQRRFFVSLDRGASVTEITSRIPAQYKDDTYVGAVIIENTFLLARHNNNNGVPPLFRSTDAGNSWTPINLNYQEAPQMYTQGKTLFLLARSQGFRSEDHGLTWTPWSVNLPPGLLPPFGIDSELAERGYLFFHGLGGLYFSRNNGEKFWPINQGLLAFGCGTENTYLTYRTFAADAANLYAIAADGTVLRRALAPIQP